MRVEDIMAKPVVTANGGESLESVAKKMLQNKIGAVVVVDAEGQATGILTETDFVEKAGLPYAKRDLPSLLGRYVTEDTLERMYQDARSRKAHQAMHKGLWSVTESDPVEKAADLMLRHNVKHLPVLRGRRPVGMVAHHDLLRAIQAPKRAVAA